MQSTTTEKYREHNIAMMDAVGVSRSARRGFAKATAYHAWRIDKVEQYRGYWFVVVELYPGSLTRMYWSIGPRGSAKEITS